MPENKGMTKENKQNWDTHSDEHKDEIEKFIC